MDNRAPFLGASYVSRARDFGYQQLINLYPEIAVTKSAAAPASFFTTPGLSLQFTIGSGPVRGLWKVDYLNNLVAVSGNSVYQVFPDFSIGTPSGALGTSSGPVYIIDNTVTTAIFDGVGAYTLQGGVSPIPLPFPLPGTPVYMDGFVFVNQKLSNIIWQSDVFNLNSWNPLNFSTSDGNQDQIIGLSQMHQYVVVFKQNHTEFWANIGSSGFVLARLQGVTIEHGCIAPASIAKLGEAVCWLGQSREGQGIAYTMNAFEPHRISTEALEYEWSTYPKMGDAIAFGYQQSGHEFYQITFPSAPGGGITWVYDATSSAMAGFPMWHQRAAFSNGAFSRHWANCFAEFQNLALVGDYQTGNVYSYDLAAQTDNGTPRKWVRGWRALKQPTMAPTRFNYLEMQMQTGIGVPDGTNPQIVMRFSDDSQNWSNPRIQPAGKTGQTNLWVRFNRLGMSKRGLAYDRIFELSSTDAFNVALMGAELG